MDIDDPEIAKNIFLNTSAIIISKPGSNFNFEPEDTSSGHPTPQRIEE